MIVSKFLYSSVLEYFNLFKDKMQKNKSKHKETPVEDPKLLWRNFIDMLN